MANCPTNADKGSLQKTLSTKAEAHFGEKKLDQVVYSLLRTKDQFLAQELYLRIESGEASFGDLASNYSEGPERSTKGIVGPVSLTQAHPWVAEVLRIASPGELRQPIQVSEWWLVLRLESYKPAIFDDDMAQRLSRDLFDQWVQEELMRKMASQARHDVALNAE